MSRADTRRTLVAYDVPLDSRRTAIAKVLQKYGDRVQYSVFVVDLSPARILRLRFELEDTMKADEDSILMCDLGPVEKAVAGRFLWLGLRKGVTGTSSIIV